MMPVFPNKMNFKKKLLFVTFLLVRKLIKLFKFDFFFRRFYLQFIIFLHLENTKHIDLSVNMF